MQLREQLVSITKKLSAIGLNQGTSGNVSVRSGDGFLVTPSGVKTEAMTPHEMVNMDFPGQVLGKDDAIKPSSEWRFHRDILQARKEVGGHHPYALHVCHDYCLPAPRYHSSIT